MYQIHPHGQGKMRTGEIPEWYSALPVFQGLKPSSKRAYSYRLREAIDVLGANVNVNKISYREADKLLLTLQTQYGPHRAVSVCNVLSAAWNLMIRYQLTDHNPFSKMRLPSLESRTDIWTPQEVLRFSAAASSLGHPSLGLLAEMAYVFCQRPIDIRLMRRDSFTGSSLVFTQVKTSVHMDIYVPSDWRRKLNTVLSHHEEEYIVINEDTNRHYTDRDYNKLAFDAKRKARIAIHKQLRDLRRTGLTEAADHEATDSELMALGGHTTIKSLNVYRKRTNKQTEHALHKRFSR